MRKTNFLFSFFRLLLLAVFVGAMVMLYWSSALLEQDMHDVRRTLEKMTKELELVRRQRVAAPPVVAKSEPLQQDAANILKVDPFYQKTLPEILGEGFVPHGTIYVTSPGRPHNLHPFSNWRHVSDWRAWCVPTAATNLFGIYETFAPLLAETMEERRDPETNIPEFWVTLRDDIYWAPLETDHFASGFTLAPWFLQPHPVTAYDFAFYFHAAMNPFVSEAGAISLRNYISDIEEFRVVDDKTFVVRWKTEPIVQPDGKTLPTPKYMARQVTAGLQPLPTFVYQYFADGTKIIENDDDPATYRTNSIWAQNFARHWAGQIIPSCGPFRFDGMSETEIHFARNRDFPLENHALIEERSVFMNENPEGAWQSFKGGETDYYVLRPDLLLEYERFLLTPEYQKQEANDRSIERLDYLDRAYMFVGWNQKKPLFRSQKVRQALTMAIDRQRIIDVLLNGMGVQLSGPFLPNSKPYNQAIHPFPFDPEEAKFLLEQQGWYDRNGDGILDNMIDGKLTPFRFSLTYYVKNPLSKTMCEFIATSLRELGIDCQLKGVDLADLTNALDDKSFDAVNLGWAFGSPPDDPKQLWHSAGATQKGSSNHVAFVNEEADQIIEALQFEYNQEKRIALYHRFHEIIHEEQPYTFLYVPKNAFLYRSNVENVFIPADRQDLIPGADVTEPLSSVFFLSDE